MFRYIFPLFLFLFVWAVGAQAQSDQRCVVGADGVITLSGTATPDATQTDRLTVGFCNADALELQYTFKSVGLCKDFPTGGIDFSSCYSFIDEDNTITISKGSTQGVEGFIPPPDSYRYSFAILDTRMALKGFVEFSEPVRGGDGTRVPNQNANGKYCQLPTYERTGGEIFDDIYPTNCSDTKPDEASLDPQFIQTRSVGLFQVGFMQSYNAGSVNNGPRIDSSAALNFVVLNEANQIASSREEADKLVIITRYTSPIVIEEGETIIDATFSTTGAFAFTFRCYDNTSFVPRCVIFTPYLGAGAFSGTVIEPNARSGAPGVADN